MSNQLKQKKKTKEIETNCSNSETDICLRESSSSPVDMIEGNDADDNQEVPVDPENVKESAL